MNLVMTICMNYEYEIYERFIGSLFDSVINTKLVIFIGSNDTVHLDKLCNIYKNIEYKVVNNENVHIVNYRFKLYYDYLLENVNIYNLIFLCDSRDVLFQKNIFLHPIISNYDLYLFEEESRHITVDRCKFNTLYIEKSGLHINHLVYNKNILCVGTILGNYKGILRYLEEFNKLLFSIDESRRIYYGTDSGINYNIIYGNLLDDLKIYVSNNKDNLVYTLAFPIHLNLINYDTLIQNNKITYNNKIVYCVHQYDRLDNINKKKISTIYNFIP